LVIGGDYNIAPEEIDVHNPRFWDGSVLTHDTVRAAFRRLLNMGFYDAGQLTGNRAFTWWDYRGGALEADDGLRIDHLLLSPQAADTLKACSIARHVRQWEKASDHAPVVITLA
jgi:exodeoxyribonuclease-3